MYVFKKELLILNLLLFFSTNIIAQEKKDLFTGITLGIQTIYSENGSGSLGFTYEPTHSIDNTNTLGLRLGGSFGFGRTIKSIDESRFRKNPDLLNISFTGHVTATYEKQFRSNEKLFRPYIGIGIGYYITTKQSFEIINNDDQFSNEEDAKTNGQILFLIRSGFNIGKFKLGLEYNYIPYVNFKISNREKVGTSKDSFTALTIGYTIDW